MVKNAFNSLPTEKRERILEAAAIEFALKGYETANVKDIALRSRISKGSLYDYFENKEDLFVAVCIYGIERSRENIDSVIDDSKDFFYQVRDIFLQGFQFVVKNPHYVQLYINIASCGMERFADKITLMVEKHMSNYYKSAIGRGIKAGTIRSDVDVNMAAFLINSLYVIMMISIVSKHYRIRLGEYLEIEDHQIEQGVKDKIDQLVNLIRFSLENKP